MFKAWLQHTGAGCSNPTAYTPPICRPSRSSRPGATAARPLPLVQSMAAVPAPKAVLAVLLLAALLSAGHAANVTVGSVGQEHHSICAAGSASLVMQLAVV